LATEYAVHHLERVASTQDEARSRFDGRPCLVTALGQEAGRGRRGSVWRNADRALAASLAVELEWPPDRVSLLTLVAGLTARGVLGGSLRLKWPNDVVTEGGLKIAGLLAEQVDSLVVVGMGVNLYWPDPMEGAGALEADDPGPERARQIGEQWAVATLAAIANGPDQWGRDEYLACSSTLGHEVIWEGGGPALAVDVAPDGGLVVEAGGLREVLRSGQVHTVRPTTLTD